jgi:hypothetical protein
MKTIIKTQRFGSPGLEKLMKPFGWQALHPDFVSNPRDAE